MRLIASRREFVSLGLFTSPDGFQADTTAATLIASLNDEGYWPAPLMRSSNRYIGDGPEMPAGGDYSETSVGDEYDTSPYIPEIPEEGIATWTYVRSMTALLTTIRARKTQSHDIRQGAARSSKGNKDVNTQRFY